MWQEQAWGLAQGLQSSSRFSNGFLGDLGGQLFCDFSYEVCPTFQQRDFLGNKMQNSIPCPDIHFPPHIWYDCNQQAVSSIITVMSLKSNLFN